MSTYAPGAPEQIWSIPDDVLDDGAKLTLMRLWAKADHEIQQTPKPTDVWAKGRDGMTPTQALHADLSEGRGCSVRKIRRHLTKLRALGLAVANGRLVHLTPPADGHAATVNGQVCPQTGDRKRADHDRKRAAVDRERSDGARKRSAHLNPPVHPSPPDPEAEDSGNDAAPEPMSLDERIAATSPAAAMSNSMGHPSNPKSWAGIMREAVLDLSLDDDAVIRVLVAWESSPRETKPTMGKLWWSSSRAWVAEAIGVKPIKRKPSNGGGWDLTSGAVYTPPAPANGGAS